MAPEHLDILGGPRRPRSETQLTKAVADLAGSDPRFAAQLAEGLLRAAGEGGNQAAIALARRLPRELDLVAELPVGTVSERRLLSGPRGGRLDWAFSAAQCLLVTEVKIDARPAITQLERYLAACRKADKALGGVVLLARRSEDIPNRVKRDRHWLGQVMWSEALPIWASIAPADPRRAEQWRELMRVVQSPDDLGAPTGGWSLARGENASARNVRLLSSVANDAVRLLAVKLASRYRLKSSDGLCAARSRPGSRTVRVARGRAELTLYVKGRPAVNLSLWGTRQPLTLEVAVDPRAAGFGSSRREKRAAVEQLTEASYALREDGWYSARERVKRDEHDVAASAAICAQIDARFRELIGTRVFDGLTW